MTDNNQVSGTEDGGLDFGQLLTITVIVIVLGLGWFLLRQYVTGPVISTIIIVFAAAILGLIFYVLHLREQQQEAKAETASGLRALTKRQDDAHEARESERAVDERRFEAVEGQTSRLGQAVGSLDRQQQTDRGDSEQAFREVRLRMLPLGYVDAANTAIATLRGIIDILPRIGHNQTDQAERLIDRLENLTIGEDFLGSDDPLAQANGLIDATAEKVTQFHAWQTAGAAKMAKVSALAEALGFNPDAQGAAEQVVDSIRQHLEQAQVPAEGVDPFAVFDADIAGWEVLVAQQAEAQAQQAALQARLDLLAGKTPVEPVVESLAEEDPAPEADADGAAAA